MKICYVVFDVAYPRGFAETASAHVKLPMYSLQLLQDAGHTVHLIANEFDDDNSVPFYSKNDSLTIHQTVDGRRLEKTINISSGVTTGIRPFNIVKQLYQIKKITDAENYDIIHYFGGGIMAVFAGFFKIFGGKAPAILTLSTGNIPTRFWFISKYFWKFIRTVITSTEFMKNNCLRAGVPAEIVRHGITRNIMDELGEENIGARHRVLFWRDPSVDNGADVCMEIYKRLAPKYPDISFDLAVRDYWAPVPGINKLAKEYKNVNLYKYPYKNGISLASLMAESICVLLPFRKLSCHPQFAVVESMVSGVPVVTTDIDSNIELINDGVNGFLTPAGDIDATAKAVENLINDRQKIPAICDKALQDINFNWNWDIYISDLIKIYSDAID